ncbi:C2H2-type zinc finger protein [Thermoplasmatales archaeon AK]|nr:C2H2-type zinc finger protein [Thermoplasmatales archaeon AK]
MPEDKEYTCPECDKTFDKPIQLANHVRVEHKAKGEGRGSKSESYLTDEDLIELREQEKRIKALEMQVREAKLQSQLKALGQDNTESSGFLAEFPPGSRQTVKFKSAKEYADLLTQYSIAVNPKTETKESVAGEGPLLQELLKQNSELQQKINEMTIKRLEDKLAYLVNRDPLSETSDSLKKLEQTASAIGFSRGSSADEVKLRTVDMKVTAINEGINILSKKIDKSMARAEKIETHALPILEKFANLYFDDFRRRRGQVGSVPHSEDELVQLTQKLDSNIQQELAEKPQEKHPEQEQKVWDPTQMPKFKLLEFSPRRIVGHETSSETATT